MSSEVTAASKSATPPVPERMSVEHFLQHPWPEGTRWELIEGEPIQMVPSPDFDHQSVAGDLHVALRKLGETVGVVRFAPFDVVLPTDDVVQPDLVVLPTSELARGMKRFEGVPRLVVEILSQSNRRHDEVTKYRVYERAGVPEYWIVDPELPSIRVYALAESAEHGTPRYELQGSDAQGFTVSPLYARRLRLVFDDPLGYRLETDEQDAGTQSPP